MTQVRLLRMQTTCSRVRERSLEVGFLAARMEVTMTFAQSTTSNSTNFPIHHSQPAFFSRGPENTAQAPSTWQTLVMPGASTTDPDSTSVQQQYVRVDAAHAAPPSPWLLCHWKEDFGWHRPLRDAANSLTPLSPPATNLWLDVNPKCAPIAEPRITITEEQQHRFSGMLVEAAHDLRSPIAVAQQILWGFTERLKQDGRCTNEELEMLQVASTRLLQANSWAEGILLERRLENQLPANIRRRFYPHQWRLCMQPLLQSLANQKRMRIVWEGWDRAQPRLYLDPNHLSRVFLNLLTNAIAASQPGSAITIRLAWQTGVTEQVILTVEDQGCGLPPTLANQINAAGQWPGTTDGNSNSGIGLRTVKSLVHVLGGAISVQSSPQSGTRFRVRLPVDNCQALVRNWLRLDTSADVPATDDGDEFVYMYAVRCLGIDGDAVDAHLHRVATASDLVYRVGPERWLWLCRSRDITQSPTDTLDKAIDWLINSSAGAHKIQGSLLSRQVFGPARVPSPANTTAEVLREAARVTAKLTERIAELVGNRVPPVDDLSGSPSVAAVQFPVVPQTRKAVKHAVRTDLQQPARRRLPTQPAWHADGQQNQASPSSGDERKPDLIGLAQQWHETQRKIDQAFSSLHPGVDSTSPATRRHRHQPPAKSAKIASRS